MYEIRVMIWKRRKGVSLFLICKKLFESFHHHQEFPTTVGRRLKSLLDQSVNRHEEEKSER